MRAELDHIVLNVSDLERSLEFYVEVVGLERAGGGLFGEDKATFPSVRINATSIIDLLPPELWGREIGGADANTARATNMDHFCLAVDPADWEPLFSRLKAAGYEPVAGPLDLSGAQGTGVGYYFVDPDGITLELRYYPEPTAD